MFIVFRKGEKMTYYGYEIHDEREVGGKYEVSISGWIYEFNTPQEAKIFIKENK